MGVSFGLGLSALLPAGLGLRNTLFNGGFQVDQRNAGAAQTITAAAVLAYTTDRWYAYCTGANVTGQRIAGSAPFQYNYQFTGATSNTAIGFGQRIEAANSFNYAGNTSVLSAYIKSSSLTSITWTLYYATTTDSFGTVASPTRTQIATGTFTISSTLTRFSTQVVIPAAATTGLELVFTSGALTATNTLVFAGVQLEQNYQPTPFEQRPIGVELALCQRYYEKSYADGVATATNTATGVHYQSSFGNASGQHFITVRFQTLKRANPTVSLWTQAGGVGAWAVISSPQAAPGYAGAASVINTTTKAFTVNQSDGGYAWQGGQTLGHWEAAIEL